MRSLSHPAGCGALQSWRQRSHHWLLTVVMSLFTTRQSFCLCTTIMTKTQRWAAVKEAILIPKSWSVSQRLTSVPFKEVVPWESEQCAGAETEMDSTAIPTLPLLILILSRSSFAEPDTETLSCPEHQEGLDGSCYEFVGLQQSFLSAQGWCERGGGHLAFILNDEAQQFLQKHLEPGKDWWLGLAPAAPNLTLEAVANEGERTCGQRKQCWNDLMRVYIDFLWVYMYLSPRI